MGMVLTRRKEIPELIIIKGFEIQSIALHGIAMYGSQF
jgi:hypothetical protein